MLESPFRGRHPVTNYFDHDLPRRIAGVEGGQLTFCGARRPGAGGHNGFDWVLPEGTPVLAAAAGEVYHAGPDPVIWCPALQDSVRSVSVGILHPIPGGDTLFTEYVHLSRVTVTAGERVEAGQRVGYSGNSGCSTGPHLHFTVGYRRARAGGGYAYIAVDPYGWRGRGPDPWAEAPDGAPSVWMWKEGRAPPLTDGG